MTWALYSSDRSRTQPEWSRTAGLVSSPDADDWFRGVASTFTASQFSPNRHL